MTFLLKASIVTKKWISINKQPQEVYVLVPMLKQMADESMVESERQKVHRTITLHFISILKGILKENSLLKNKDKPVVNEGITETLWFYEPNIWDSIFRSLDIKNEENVWKERTIQKENSLKTKQTMRFDKKTAEHEVRLENPEEYEIERKVRLIYDDLKLSNI